MDGIWLWLGIVLSLLLALGLAERCLRRRGHNAQRWPLAVRQVLLLLLLVWLGTWPLRWMYLWLISRWP